VLKFNGLYGDRADGRGIWGSGRWEMFAVLRWWVTKVAKLTKYSSNGYL